MEVFNKVSIEQMKFGIIWKIVGLMSVAVQQREFKFIVFFWLTTGTQAQAMFNKNGSSELLCVLTCVLSGFWVDSKRFQRVLASFLFKHHS